MASLTRKTTTGPIEAAAPRGDVARALAVLREAGAVDVMASALEIAEAIGMSHVTIWNWRPHICGDGCDPHHGGRWVSVPRLRAFLHEHWHGNVPPGVADRLDEFNRDKARWRLILPGDDMALPRDTRAAGVERTPARRAARRRAAAR